MPYQQGKPRSFGADDKLACPNCSKPTSLTRRSPDTDYDLDCERQIFTCRACGHQIERVVNVDGNPPEYPRRQQDRGWRAQEIAPRRSKRGQ